MTITLTPELEAALAREAERLGLTPEELAQETLRARLDFANPANNAQNSGRTLADLFAGRIGLIHGTAEALSENTGEKFTEHLVKKHREGHL